MIFGTVRNAIFFLLCFPAPVRPRLYEFEKEQLVCVAGGKSAHNAGMNVIRRGWGSFHFDAQQFPGTQDLSSS